MSSARHAVPVERVVVPAGTTTSEAVAGAGLPADGPDAVVVARTADGALKDLSWAPATDVEVEPVSLSSPDGLDVLRHSTAHVLAQAVQDLFPDARLGTGPPIENGFYYDFAVETPFRPDDLDRVETRMREIVAAGQRFQRRATSVGDATVELGDEPYKLELVADHQGDAELTIYDNVDAESGGRCWSDLCRGPHLPSTGHIPAFRLLRSAAAYWRGDEKNAQLQRVYGTAWPTPDALEEHVRLQEEAAKRDHRRIGEALELFTFSKEIGKGLPLWLPNGTIVRDELEQWARQIEGKRGYQRVVTPHITKEELYRLSGHVPYYDEDLYAPIEIEGERYYLKPMNCPHHHMIYRSRPRSYRELPYKLAEHGTVYRFERSGQLHGMMRTRGFTQNDAHVYCGYDQAKAQFVDVMRMHEDYYRTLGITDFHMVLALRDPSDKDKYHGDEEMWRTAERITREAMDESNIPYVEDPGGAAHYGPKVDFVIRAVTGKEFSASTNQIDLYTPQRFGLTFRDSDGAEKPVAVVHQAPLGSHERFVAYLTEHFGGAFPVWLAPEQVRVIPIADDLAGHATEVRDVLVDTGVRADVDTSDNRLNAKVRAAVARKVALIVVLGRREREHGTVSVRYRSGAEESMPLAAFVTHVTELIRTRSLDGAGHLTGGRSGTT